MRAETKAETRRVALTLHGTDWTYLEACSKALRIKLDIIVSSVVLLTLPKHDELERFLSAVAPRIRKSEGKR